MRNKQAAQITKLEYRPLAEALRRVLPKSSNAAIVTLTGHVAHETGMRLCYNWNLGNIKSVPNDGRDYTFFRCGENMPVDVAKAENAKFPALVHLIGEPYTRDGKVLQEVRVFPEHSWSRFRAYASLDEGVRDFIKVLQLKRYAKVWPALEEGDIALVSDELGKAGYFTAGPESYRAALRREVARVRGIFLGRPTLRLGDVSEDVKYWQELALGMKAPDADGKFGPRTLALTRQWQQQRGLNPDGEVGPVSWANAHPAFEVRV
jgi:peptidoglycan hydrolase-like protein with peptidoglycan-binding domain